MKKTGKIFSTKIEARKRYAYNHVTTNVTIDLTSGATLKIRKVQFSNQDGEGNIITDYGCPLHEKNLQFICPKIHYKSLYVEDHKVTLYYKIFDAEGIMKSTSSSPQGFTGKQQIVIEPEEDSLELKGINKRPKTRYPAGTYRMEIWLNGKMLHATTFRITREAKTKSKANANAKTKTKTN